MCSAEGPHGADPDVGDLEVRLLVDVAGEQDAPLDPWVLEDAQRCRQVPPDRVPRPSCPSISDAVEGVLVADQELLQHARGHRSESRAVDSQPSSCAWSSMRNVPRAPAPASGFTTKGRPTLGGERAARPPRVVGPAVAGARDAGLARTRSSWPPCRGTGGPPRRRHAGDAERARGPRPAAPAGSRGWPAGGRRRPGGRPSRATPAASSSGSRQSSRPPVPGQPLPHGLGEALRGSRADEADLRVGHPYHGVDEAGGGVEGVRRDEDHVGHRRRTVTPRAACDASRGEAERGRRGWRARRRLRGDSATAAAERRQNVRVHVVFVEPSFPDNQKQFVRGAARGRGHGDRHRRASEGLAGRRRQAAGSATTSRSRRSSTRDAWPTPSSGCSSGFPVERLEATIEAHVMPAARVREALGIPGTSVQTAFLCRDKPAMKEALRAAGIPCARSIGATSGGRDPGLRRRGRASR